MATATESDVVKTSDDSENESPAVQEGPMAELLRSAPKVRAIEDVAEGPVVAIGRARVFVDLPPFGTGIIFGREYLSARETLKNVHIGDTITAKVVGTDNAEGYVELSLR